MKKMPVYHKLIATALGAGFFPYGPGTMGALLAILIWCALAVTINYSLLCVVTGGLIVVFTGLGVWSSTVAEKYWGKDPSRVVIDEVVGQWIVLLAVPASFQWWEVVTALALFRFFDIVKPLGVRKMERLKAGWGIMADDILAGCYGVILLYVINQI